MDKQGNASTTCFYCDLPAISEEHDREEGRSVPICFECIFEAYREQQEALHLGGPTEAEREAMRA